ncbi:MAG: hypothetical protein HQL28_04200 [Candidatus Omnitrophica bacterium]|nr:hypothetical protein [Candidatus Omnitrophota bacterium]
MSVVEAKGKMDAFLNKIIENYRKEYEGEGWWRLVTLYGWRLHLARNHARLVQLSRDYAAALKYRGGRKDIAIAFAMLKTFVADKGASSDIVKELTELKIMLVEKWKDMRDIPGTGFPARADIYEELVILLGNNNFGADLTSDIRKSCFELLSEAVKTDGNSFKACALRGLIYFENKKYDEALTDLEKALTLSYGDADLELAEKLCGILIGLIDANENQLVVRDGMKVNKYHMLAVAIKRKKEARDSKEKTKAPSASVEPIANAVFDLIVKPKSDLTPKDTSDLEYYWFELGVLEGYSKLVEKVKALVNENKFTKALRVIEFMKAKGRLASAARERTDLDDIQKEISSKKAKTVVEGVAEGCRSVAEDQKLAILMLAKELGINDAEGLYGNSGLDDAISEELKKNPHKNDLPKVRALYSVYGSTYTGRRLGLEGKIQKQLKEYPDFAAIREVLSDLLTKKDLYAARLFVNTLEGKGLWQLFTGSEKCRILVTKAEILKGLKELDEANKALDKALEIRRVVTVSTPTRFDAEIMIKKAGILLAMKTDSKFNEAIVLLETIIGFRESAVLDKDFDQEIFGLIASIIDAAKIVLKEKKDNKDKVDIEKIFTPSDERDIFRRLGILLYSADNISKIADIFLVPEGKTVPFGLVRILFDAEKTSVEIKKDILSKLKEMVRNSAVLSEEMKGWLDVLSKGAGVFERLKGFLGNKAVRKKNELSVRAHAVLGWADYSRAIDDKLTPQQKSGYFELAYAHFKAAADSPDLLNESKRAKDICRGYVLCILKAGHAVAVQKPEKMHFWHERLVRRLLADIPDDHEFNTLFANLLMRYGRFDDAIKVLQKNIAIAKTKSDKLRTLELMLEAQLGKIENADPAARIENAWFVRGRNKEIEFLLAWVESLLNTYREMASLGSAFTVPRLMADRINKAFMNGLGSVLRQEKIPAKNPELYLGALKLYGETAIHIMGDSRLAWRVKTLFVENYKLIKSDPEFLALIRDASILKGDPYDEIIKWHERALALDSSYASKKSTAMAGIFRQKAAEYKEKKGYLGKKRYLEYLEKAVKLDPAAPHNIGLVLEFIDVLLDKDNVLLKKASEMLSDLRNIQVSDREIPEKDKKDFKNIDDAGLRQKAVDLRKKEEYLRNGADKFDELVQMRARAGEIVDRLKELGNRTAREKGDIVEQKRLGEELDGIIADLDKILLVKDCPALDTPDRVKARLKFRGRYEAVEYKKLFIDQLIDVFIGTVLNGPGMDKAALHTALLRKAEEYLSGGRHVKAASLLHNIPTDKFISKGQLDERDLKRISARKALLEAAILSCAARGETDKVREEKLGEAVKFFKKIVDDNSIDADISCSARLGMAKTKISQKEGFKDLELRRGVREKKDELSMLFEILDPKTGYLKANFDEIKGYIPEILEIALDKCRQSPRADRPKNYKTVYLALKGLLEMTAVADPENKAILDECLDALKKCLDGAAESHGFTLSEESIEALKNVLLTASDPGTVTKVVDLFRHMDIRDSVDILNRILACNIWTDKEKIEIISDAGRAWFGLAGKGVKYRDKLSKSSGLDALINKIGAVLNIIPNENSEDRETLNTILGFLYDGKGDGKQATKYLKKSGDVHAGLIRFKMLLGAGDLKGAVAKYASLKEKLGSWYSDEIDDIRKTLIEKGRSDISDHKDLFLELFIRYRLGDETKSLVESYLDEGTDAGLLDAKVIEKSIKRTQYGLVRTFSFWRWERRRFLNDLLEEVRELIQSKEAEQQAKLASGAVKTAAKSAPAAGPAIKLPATPDEIKKVMDARRTKAIQNRLDREKAMGGRQNGAWGAGKGATRGAYAAQNPMSAKVPRVIGQPAPRSKPQPVGNAPLGPAGQIARGDAGALAGALVQRGNLKPIENSDSRFVARDSWLVTRAGEKIALVRLVDERLVAPEDKQAVKDAVEEFEKLIKTGKVVDFSAIVGMDRESYLLGFNTGNRKGAETGKSENTLRNLRNAINERFRNDKGDIGKLADTQVVGYAREVLEAINSENTIRQLVAEVYGGGLPESKIKELQTMLLQEYLLHEILCAKVGHEKARMIQEKLFTDLYPTSNERRATSNELPGHKDGLLGAVLGYVITIKNKPTFDVSEKIAEQIESIMSLGLIGSRAAEIQGIKLNRATGSASAVVRQFKSSRQFLSYQIKTNGLIDKIESKLPSMIRGRFYEWYQNKYFRAIIDWFASKLMKLSKKQNYDAYVTSVTNSLMSKDLSRSPVGILLEREGDNVSANVDLINVTRNGVQYKLSKSEAEERLRQGVIFLIHSRESWSDILKKSGDDYGDRTLECGDMWGIRNFDSLPLDMIAAIFVPEHLFGIVKASVPRNFRGRIIKVSGEIPASSVKDDDGSSFWGEEFNVRIPDWPKAINNYILENCSELKGMLLLHGSRLPLPDENNVNLKEQEAIAGSIGNAANAGTPTAESFQFAIENIPDLPGKCVFLARSFAPGIENNDIRRLAYEIMFRLIRDEINKMDDAAKIMFFNGILTNIARTYAVSGREVEGRRVSIGLTDFLQSISAPGFSCVQQNIDGVFRSVIAVMTINKSTMYTNLGRAMSPAELEMIVRYGKFVLKANDDRFMHVPDISSDAAILDSTRIYASGTSFEGRDKNSNREVLVILKDVPRWEVKGESYAYALRHFGAEQIEPGYVDYLKERIALLEKSADPLDRGGVSELRRHAERFASGISELGELSASCIDWGITLRFNKTMRYDAEKDRFQKAVEPIIMDGVRQYGVHGNLDRSLAAVVQTGASGGVAPAGQIARTVQDLPQLPAGWIRAVHIIRPGSRPDAAKLIQDKGLDYSKYGVVRSMTRVSSDSGLVDIEYNSADPNFSGPEAVAVVFDAPSEEWKKHESRSTATGVIPGNYVVGIVPATPESTALGRKQALAPTSAGMRGGKNVAVRTPKVLIALLSDEYVDLKLLKTECPELAEAKFVVSSRGRSEIENDLSQAEGYEHKIIIDVSGNEAINKDIIAGIFACIYPELVGIDASKLKNLSTNGVINLSRTLSELIPNETPADDLLRDLMAAYEGGAPNEPRATGHEPQIQATSDQRLATDREEVLVRDSVQLMRIYNKARTEGLDTAAIARELKSNYAKLKDILARPGVDKAAALARHSDIAVAKHYEDRAFEALRDFKQNSLNPGKQAIVVDIRKSSGLQRDLMKQALMGLANREDNKDVLGIFAITDPGESLGWLGVTEIPVAGHGADILGEIEKSLGPAIPLSSASIVVPEKIAAGFSNERYKTANFVVCGDMSGKDEDTIRANRLIPLIALVNLVKYNSATVTGIPMPSLALVGCSKGFSSKIERVLKNFVQFFKITKINITREVREYMSAFTATATSV